MMKRFCAGILCIALTLTLCSCSRAPSAETKTEIVLPEPYDEPVQMIRGETIAAEPESVSVYHVSDDGTSFTTITRSVLLSQEENLYAEAVRALLNSSTAPERMEYIPVNTRLLDVEYARGIATVNLSLDVETIQSEQEYLMLLATITNTLLSLEHVMGVNILVDGRTEAIAELPIGAQTNSYKGITPAYAQISAERDYFLESETGTITRNAVLYFPTLDGEWFIPELREISFDSSNYAASLIRALRAGPESTSCAISAIPEGADLLVNNPTIEISSSGERVLILDFSSTLLNYLAFSGLEKWQLIGSIVLTTCSFVPEIDAVRIFVGGDAIEDCMVGETEFTYPDALIRRSDFSAHIASTIQLYLPNKTGTLDVIERAQSMVRAQSPQSLIYALFEEVEAYGGNAAYFPLDVYYDDLLGISVSDGIASVNLSAEFYRQAQALDAASERSVVYAIVNTLCELDGISGVRFYIEGISTETLSGSIYLKGVLLPNPGIVASEQTAVPEITASP